MSIRNIQVVLGVAFGVLLFLFLDYSLPSRDTVRIANTYNKMTDLGWNRIFYASTSTGAVETAEGRRDVRYIDTLRPNGRPRVYRNEDTGLIWPPYFKYDSSDLHAIAGDMRSTADSPRWVSITSYGWRSDLIAIFPNAISVRPVAGPQDRPANWLAMVILGLLGLGLLVFWRWWNRFSARRIAPAVERAEARADQARGRFRRWLGR